MEPIRGEGDQGRRDARRELGQERRGIRDLEATVGRLVHGAPTLAPHRCSIRIAPPVESIRMDRSDRSPRPAPGKAIVYAQVAPGRDGGYQCAHCGATVPWAVAKYCRDQRGRFGGRLYCRSCQAAFPSA